MLSAAKHLVSPGNRCGPRGCFAAASHGAAVISQSCPVIVQDAGAVGTGLQVTAGANALEFAGCENDAAPLAGVLFDLRDGAALFGAAQGFIALKERGVEAAGQARA